MEHLEGTLYTESKHQVRWKRAILKQSANETAYRPINKYMYFRNETEYTRNDQ